MSGLALDGGRPVREEMLPYARQQIGEDDIAAVTAAMREPWLTTGPAVAKFEERLALAVGAGHAVALSSGTAALHAAAFASGVGPGDEVVVPALTFVATANCVRYMGGTVIFADVRSGTLTIDPESVRDRLSPRTRAIVAVDYAGQPADIEELRALSTPYDSVLIEDAAHSLGAAYRGRPVGSLADMTTFSFHPVKHVTTGEGGMVTTDDAELARKVRSFRNHGIASDHWDRDARASWRYEMEELGFNYRLTDIQCSLGIAQLGKLDELLSRRRELAKRYMDSLSDIPELELPVTSDDRESAWHLFVIRLHLDRLRAGRDEIFRALRAENIGVNVHYMPVHLHPYYARLGYGRGLCPVAEAEFERLLTLPLYPLMTDGDADDVTEALEKVLRHYSLERVPPGR